MPREQRAPDSLRGGPGRLLLKEARASGVLEPSIISIVMFTVIVNADFAGRHDRSREGAGDLDTVADSLGEEVSEGQRGTSLALDGG